MPELSTRCAAPPVALVSGGGGEVWSCERAAGVWPRARQKMMQTISRAAPKGGRKNFLAICDSRDTMPALAAENEISGAEKEHVPCFARREAPFCDVVRKISGIAVRCF